MDHQSLFYWAAELNGTKNIHNGNVSVWNDRSTLQRNITLDSFATCDGLITAAIKILKSKVFLYGAVLFYRLVSYRSILYVIFCDVACSQLYFDMWGVCTYCIHLVCRCPSVLPGWLLYFKHSCLKYGWSWLMIKSSIIGFYLSNRVKLNAILLQSTFFLSNEYKSFLYINMKYYAFIYLWERLNLCYCL